MTDRIIALTVILETPTRDDDCEGLIDAIRRLRGVADVQPHIADHETYWAQETARQTLVRELWDVLNKKTP